MLENIQLGKTGHFTKKTSCNFPILSKSPRVTQERSRLTFDWFYRSIKALRPLMAEGPT